MSTDEIIYNLATIHLAVIPSLNGVMKLEDSVKVKASEWKECFQEISELCAMKWVITNKNRCDGSLSAEQAFVQNKLYSFSEKYICHRHGSYRSKASVRPIQKQSKRINCTAALRIRRRYDAPDYYEFIPMNKEHVNHVPGDRATDLRTLPLARARLNEIVQQLKHSSKSPRQIRIDMLKDVDKYGRSFERRVNYHDVWNLMNQVGSFLGLMKLVLTSCNRSIKFFIILTKITWFLSRFGSMINFLKWAT